MSLATRAQEYDPGSPVEVAYRSAFSYVGGRDLTVRGRFRAFISGELYIEVGGELRRISEDRVRYLSPVNEEAHCASFHYGDEVRITKYGGQYIATVERHMRTHLQVTFTTRGGKVKSQRIPAIECERVVR